jgi:hypothetical protein
MSLGCSMGEGCLGCGMCEEKDSPESQPDQKVGDFRTSTATKPTLKFTLGDILKQKGIHGS